MHEKTVYKTRALRAVTHSMHHHDIAHISCPIESTDLFDRYIDTGLRLVDMNGECTYVFYIVHMLYTYITYLHICIREEHVVMYT